MKIMDKPEEPVSRADWRKQQMVESQRRLREQRRVDAVAHYGDRCRCCNTQANVSIYADDGRSKRQVCGAKTTVAFLRWLDRNGWPQGFQVLCISCKMRRHGHRPCSPEDHKQAGEWVE